MTDNAISDAADIVVNRVCEYDDRTSPDDYPEMLLITPEELHKELMRFALSVNNITLNKVRKPMLLCYHRVTNNSDEACFGKALDILSEAEVNEE